MSQLEYELHWERVWNLLMLSRTMQNELGIPADIEPIQLCLRETFEHHYKTNELMFSAGLLSIRLSTRLRSFFDEENVLYILLT